ncbi:MAG: PKD domain-containing protein, partial [Actinomycetota bacterium]
MRRQTERAGARRLAIVLAYVLAIAAVVPGLAATTTSAVDVGQFIIWPDGRSFTRFGPNAPITIGTGKINFEPVCPTTGTPDGFLPFADVYVVRSGVVRTIEAGETKLAELDPAKLPNTVQGSAGGGIIDEVIGYTKPSGKHGEGRWAVIIDECQDGVYTEGQDAIFNPAFEVTPIPVGLPPLPEIEEQKTEWKGQKERLKEVAEQFDKFLEQADKIEDALDKMNGGVRANRLISKLAIDSASLLQDPIPKICEKATAPLEKLDDKTGELAVQVTNVAEADQAAKWLAGKGRDQIKSLCEKLAGAGNRWLLDPRDIAKVHLANTVKHYEGLEADPPRADFDVVTTLQPWQVVDDADGGDVNRAIYRLAEALGGEQAISLGLLDALERYQGAQDARNGSGGLGQARATARFARLLADWQPSMLAGLQSFRDALAANQADIDLALDDARAAAARYEAGLLTPDEIDLWVHQQFFLEEWALMLASVGASIDDDTTVANLLALIDAQIAGMAGFADSMDELASDVELIVDELTANPLVDDAHPVAHAGGPYTTPMGAAVVLDGTGSTSASSTIASYEWDFDGDGDFDDAVGPQPSFNHPDPLLGLVGLRVTDALGAIGVDYAPVTVTSVGGPPTASQVRPDGTITIRLDDTAEFEVAAADPDGDPTAIQWQFDLVDVPGATGSVFSYTPTEIDQIGLWRVDAVVTAGGERTRQNWILRVRGADADADGYDVPLDCNDANPEIRPVRDEIIGNSIDDDCSDATSDEGDPPTADFSVDPVGAGVGETVTFTDQSTEGSATVVGVDWNFGDGDTGTGSPATHVYSAPGDYLVTQTVTDALGKSDISTRTVSVRIAPTAAFDAPLPIVAGEPAVFTDTSTDDGSIVSRAWDFGDGTTSTDINPSVTFGTPGTRTVTLIATDNDGLSRSTAQSVDVLARPTAVFDLMQVPAGPGATVEFVDRSTDDAPITSWDWSFGDGATSTDRDPTHDYTAPGTYEVTLTVTDSGGLTDTSTITVVIGTPPTAAFGFAPGSDIDPGETVTFTDTSTPGDAPIVDRSWAFGDGTTSTAPSPTHIFTTTGAFPVSLTVTDGNGASATIVQVVAVSVVPPVAAFTVGPGPHYAGDPVGFFDASSDPDGVVTTREWSFGDGGSSTETNPSNTFADPGIYPVNLTVTD